MNKVDLHIKNMMLNYPLIFSSRMACLHHLFMVNGNGYDWKKGCLVSCDNERQGDTMRYDDLPDYATLESTKVKHEFDMMCRKFRADHIDLFASNHVLREDDHYGVEWLRHFSPDWCVMKWADYENMDRDWALAAEETFGIVKRAIWRFLVMYDKEFNRDRADPELIKLYVQVVGILEKLDGVTNSKAIESEFEKFITERL